MRFQKIYFLTIIAFLRVTNLFYAMFIVRHEVLVNLYAERLKAGYPKSDPLETYTLEERQATCDKIMLANEFVHFPGSLRNIPPSTDLPVDLATENYQRFAASQENPKPPLQYLKRHVFTVKYAKMFPCMVTATNELYVTFGLEHNQLFLIEQTRAIWWPRLVISAMIELSTAEFDKQFWTPDNLTLLQEYFANQIQQTKIPENMQLTYLKLNSHIRVCSAVFDIISTPENGYFQEDIRKVNYVRVRVKSVYRSIQVTISSMAYHIHTTILPCSINRPADSFQFYLLADPLKEGVVFLFVDRTATSDEIILIGQVENVGVLLEVYNYHSIVSMA